MTLTKNLVIGQAIFEIGMRLKWVKENDLAHGEFGKWLGSIGLNHRIANQMMKVASELDLNSRTSSYLGLEALYQIATIPNSSMYSKLSSRVFEIKKSKQKQRSVQV